MIATASRFVRPMLLAVGVTLLCYAFAWLPREVPTLNYTFNSMLDHLLQGRFDVDPAIVGREGFTIGGRVYAYWGVLPALLRLPMALLPGWRHLDFTISYCLVAVAGMATVKLWTLRLIQREVPGLSAWLRRGMAAVLLFSGAQLCFLRFSLYQEVCLWAALWGAIFVAAAISAQLRGLGRGELLVMAAMAGLAMLTRVSLGIGLVAAFAGLLLIEAIRLRAHWRRWTAEMTGPILVLAIAGALTAFVNWGRWGDPFVFADYHHYNYNAWYPDRVARMAEQGLFNLQRVPFGLIYYFAPVWVLHGADGQLLFEATRQKWIDAAELPPSSFLLTDPLLLLLGCIAVKDWARTPLRRSAQGIAIAAGLALPPLLMLCAVSMNFRYRLDFYPLFEFLAFTGLIVVARRGRGPGRRTTATLASISVVASVLILAAYLVGRFGPGQLLIGNGIGTYYLQAFGIR